MSQSQTLNRLRENVAAVQNVVDKLRPRRFPDMSGRMAALVSYILSQRWTNPVIAELAVTSDGYVLARDEDDVDMNIFIGSLADLKRNWKSLLDCAGLTPAERRVAEAAFVRRVPTGG